VIAAFLLGAIISHHEVTAAQGDVTGGTGFPTHCDWAQRYVTIEGRSQSSIELSHKGSVYLVKGLLAGRSKELRRVRGEFAPTPGALKGRIVLRGNGHVWTGRWNQGEWLFDIRGKTEPNHLKMVQELHPNQFSFLSGKLPLEERDDLARQFPRFWGEVETLFAFPGKYADVVRSADAELLGEHWRKAQSRPQGSSTREYVSYQEPGPAGRSLTIEPDTSRPERRQASSSDSGALRRKGWVGIRLTEPMFHA
jgi:hypothetical protein